MRCSGGGATRRRAERLASCRQRSTIHRPAPAMGGHGSSRQPCTRLCAAIKPSFIVNWTTTGDATSRLPRRVAVTFDVAWLTGCQSASSTHRERCELLVPCSSWLAIPAETGLPRFQTAANSAFAALFSPRHLLRARLFGRENHGEIGFGDT